MTALRRIDNSCPHEGCDKNVNGQCYRDPCPYDQPGYPSKRHIKDAQTVCICLAGAAVLVIIATLLHLFH